MEHIFFNWNQLLNFQFFLFIKIMGYKDSWYKRVEPDFLEELLLVQELLKICEEYGVTTGRKRTVNWLNLDKNFRYNKFNSIKNRYIRKSKNI